PEPPTEQCAYTLLLIGYSILEKAKNYTVSLIFTSLPRVSGLFFTMFPQQRCDSSRNAALKK
ncbi:MAG: hypothetical protein ACRC61_13675, partial [Aeromonas salmonicida]